MAQKPRVLLIDDLRNFREGIEFRFRENTADADVTIARTSAEALDILAEQNDWDEIWLDHDLGEPNGQLDTIMPVVDYLSEKAFNDEPVNVNWIFIHTSNPVGRDQMALTLSHFGYMTQKMPAEQYFIV